MKRVRRFLSVVLTMAFIVSMVPFFGAGGKVHAADTMEIEITGTYGQTEARSMLKMVNDFRTGRSSVGNPWAWDENSSKIYYTGLGELTYSYELEEIAMKRAREIAVKYSHTRPNGQTCWTAYTSSFENTYRAENIAANYNSAESVFIGWREDDDDYDGQGHRRNMLGKNFKAIGIGHVFYNGTHYWVQEFSSFVPNETATTPNDSVFNDSVEISTSDITDLKLSTVPSDISIEYGKYIEIPTIKKTIKFNGTWPSRYLTVDFPVSLSIANSSVAKIEGNNIHATMLGSTALQVTADFDNNVKANIPVKVVPVSISNASVTVTTQTYTGSELKPEPTVTLEGKTLIEGTDYELSYSNNINAGQNTATVKVTGINNYKDTVEKKFTINPRTLDDSMVTLNKTSFTYNGTVQKPIVTVADGSKNLQVGTDYTVTIGENKNAGTYDVKVEGKGNYAGTVNKTYTITAKNLTDSMVNLDETELEYSGDVRKPTVTVKDGTNILTADTDYVLTNNGGTNAGDYDVVIDGRGNYTGRITKSFTITQKPLTDDMVSISPGSFTYNSENQKPSDVTVKFGNAVLTEGTDYTVTNNGGANAGTYNVTINAAANSNFSGNATAQFTIEPKEISESMISLNNAEFTYNGTNQAPTVTVEDGTIMRATDYTISNPGGTNKGEYSVTVTGKNNYKGTASKNFRIIAKPISDTDITVANIPAQTYNTKALAPAPMVNFGTTALKNGTDFNLSYDKNTNAGTASVTITGKGNYDGSRSATFTILSKDINSEDITVDKIPDQAFKEGDSPKTPAVTVKYGLVKLSASDYGVSYENNDKIGIAKATISGKGNYSGNRDIEFKIIDKAKADAINVLKAKIADIEKALGSATDGEYKAALAQAIEKARAALEDENATADSLKTAAGDAESAKTTADNILKEKIAAKEAAKQKAAEEAVKKKAAEEAAKKKAAEEAAKKKAAAEQAAVDNFAKENNVSADTLKITEEVITKGNTDSDLKGSSFGLLKAYAKKNTKNAVTLKWSKVAKADGYLIYGNKCGKNNKMKLLKTITTNKTTSFTQKKLKKGTYYKYIVIAYKNIGGKKLTLTASPTIHTVTKGGKFGVAKSVSVTKVGSKKRTKTTLKKGKTAKIVAKEVKTDKKIKNHRKLCYETSNTKVATVSKKGVIKAVRKGKCKIYVYAQNGVSKAVTITVK